MLIESRDAVDTVLIHPAFDRAFFVTEHPAGELDALGDALGCDCIVARLDHGWRWHAGDGSRNEDWYSWRVPVLAPCQATIERVQHPSGTTQPGQPAHHPPGQIVFRCDDETHVVYGHVDGIIVQVGDMVQAGQLVAVVGNNGFAWYPHLHVGAWRDARPLQIRFDLVALGQLRQRDPDHYYGITSDAV